MEYKEALVAVGIRVSGSLKPTWALLGGKNPPKQTNKTKRENKEKAVTILVLMGVHVSFLLTVLI